MDAIANKALDIVEIYSNQGATSVLRRFPKFIRRQIFKPWHLTGERIYEKGSKEIIVQPPNEKTIEYAGRFRDSLPQRFVNIEGKISTPERVIVEHTSAFVLHSKKIVRLGRKYLVPMEVGSGQRYTPRLSNNITLCEVVYNYTGRAEADLKLKNGFLLTGKRGLPFAHWFYETLPKLRWYERYCKIRGCTIPLIIPAELTKWQQDSLALMGYPESSMIKKDFHTAEVKRLAIPPHPYRNRGSQFTGSPANFRWIKNRILSNVSKTDRSYPTRVYISRNDADRRRVRNEKELMKVLTKMGFEKFKLSDLPFEEQVQLFVNADIVVGAHGAGLTNMLYSTDLNVVELLTNEGASEHFFVLANELNHSYEFITCEPVNNTSPPRHKDMVADPDRVQKVIKNL